MTREPRFRAGAAALWAAAGAALALLAVEWLGDDGPPPDSPVAERRETRAQAGPASAERGAGGAETAAERAPVAVVQAQQDAAAALVRPANPPVPPSNPIVADAPPSNSRGTSTDLPNRRNGDPATSAPGTHLLDSTRISCDFGAGNITGTRIGDVLTVGGGAQWQGGLILYDLTGPGAGTARMTGSVGATGSPNGETDVQVTTEGTRVFLSGFLANRTYVMVTIFDELDYVGRHIAVMSRHEDVFTYASQFIGTCE
jgi:hypothetical protein